MHRAGVGAELAGSPLPCSQAGWLAGWLTQQGQQAGGDRHQHAVSARRDLVEGGWQLQLLRSEAAVLE